jgi:hypothetical protein
VARGVRLPPDLPARIGPVEFSMLGGMGPADLAPLMRRAGGMEGAGHPPAGCCGHQEHILSMQFWHGGAPNGGHQFRCG